MRLLIFIILAIFLGLGFVYFYTAGQENSDLLSANDNRLERMTDFCNSQNPDLSKEQCICIFTKSLDTNLSNVDLYNFYDGKVANMPPEKTTTFNALKTECQL